MINIVSCRHFNCIFPVLLTSVDFSFPGTFIGSCLRVCSVSMVLFNKALVSSFHYDSFVALILLQNIIGLCCLVLLRRNFDFVKFPLKLELRHIKIWFPANIFFLFMLVTGSGSLHGLPIQLVTVFKNTTNVIIAIGDWLFFSNVLLQWVP